MLIPCGRFQIPSFVFDELSLRDDIVGAEFLRPSVCVFRDIGLGLADQILFDQLIELETADGGKRLAGFDSIPQLDVNLFDLPFDARRDFGHLFEVERDFAQMARQALLRVPDVGKVEIYGLQDERLYVELSRTRLAQYRLTVAQVVAAAFQRGDDAGQVGTVAKLTRVMMLAPLVLGLGLLATRRRGADDAGQASAPVPWFVFGFIALIGVNSLGLVPPEAKQVLVPATTFMLTVALAAMGLETDLRKLAAKGIRPLLLGALATVFIAVVSLGLVWGLV